MAPKLAQVRHKKSLTSELSAKEEVPCRLLPRADGYVQRELVTMSRTHAFPLNMHLCLVGNPGALHGGIVFRAAFTHLSKDLLLKIMTQEGLTCSFGSAQVQQDLRQYGPLLLHDRGVLPENLSRLVQ